MVATSKRKPAAKKKAKPATKKPTKKQATEKPTKAVVLPAPADLERICKGLAALDTMLAADWEDRYYSFDPRWNEPGKQRMASMRDGEGDEWFIVFGPSGAFIKAFCHEYPVEDLAKIYDGLPAALQPQLQEEAFTVDDITFGGWHDGTAWTLRGNAKPLAQQLAMLRGDAASYCAYAANYFEVELPTDAVADVLAGKSIDAKLVKRITRDRTYAELKPELAELGF